MLLFWKQRFPSNFTKAFQCRVHSRFDLPSVDKEQISHPYRPLGFKLAGVLPKLCVPIEGKANSEIEPKYPAGQCLSCIPHHEGTRSIVTFPKWNAIPLKDNPLPLLFFQTSNFIRFSWQFAVFISRTWILRCTLRTQVMIPDVLNLDQLFYYQASTSPQYMNIQFPIT